MPGPAPPTLTNAKSTGDSPAATPESNFGTYTQCFRGDGLLAHGVSPMATRKRRPQGAGSVRQLPSGRWQARYRDGSALRSAPVTFDTKLDAGAWLADYAEGVEVAP